MRISKPGGRSIMQARRLHILQLLTTAKLLHMFLRRINSKKPSTKQPMLYRPDDAPPGMPQRWWDGMSHADRTEHKHKQRVQSFRDQKIPQDQWDKSTRDRYDQNKKEAKPNE